MALLRAAPPETFGPLGAAMVCLVAGLLLDSGLPGGVRVNAAHLLQATAVVLFGYDAALLLWKAGSRSVALALCEVGIAVALAGVLAEMRLRYPSLKAAVWVQALGDVLFLAGAVTAWVGRDPNLGTMRWVFIALAGLLSLYAAVTNALLQFSRLRNPQAGWRFRVLGLEDDGLRLKTPSAEARIAWRHIEGVKQLDARHLLLVLPSPLPPELKASGLPFEELREGEEAVVSETAPPPEKYGFVLHEQELGRGVPEAEQLFETRSVSTRVQPRPGQDR